MEKAIVVFWLLFCLMLTSCRNSNQSSPNAAATTNQVSLLAGADLFTSLYRLPRNDFTENIAYVEAFTDFLLNSDIDEGHEFLSRGYYLFNLDFDNIPELGVLHDSLGSMGGYFTYYRFDGEGIVPILSNEGSPARCSNYTQALADFENKKIYFLKEMYLLRGNENGVYGYVRELVIQDDVPCVYSILDLNVDQDSDLKRHFKKYYTDEDDHLADAELDERLITRYYSQGGWNDISSEKYLRLKRELIPVENTFVDLRDTDARLLIPEEEMFDGALGPMKSRQITLEEIDTLFSKWLKNIK